MSNEDLLNENEELMQRLQDEIRRPQAELSEEVIDRQIEVKCRDKELADTARAEQDDNAAYWESINQRNAVLMESVRKLEYAKEQDRLKRERLYKTPEEIKEIREGISKINARLALRKGRGEDPEIRDRDRLILKKSPFPSVAAFCKWAREVDLKPGSTWDNFPGWAKVCTTKTEFKKWEPKIRDLVNNAGGSIRRPKATD